MVDTIVSNHAKSVDFIIRSVVTAALAIGLIGAVVYCAISGKHIDSEILATLTGFAGAVMGYYYGNHAAVNGSMLQTLGARRAVDAENKVE